ncbi:UNVERIFIED_CONTAM: hypothetical protein HDU68_004770 [Siphonaria sp. JEL0065]|nr:hypothetical protein HDU68_004770 [Siphonaria sp. JEL0065]
MKLLFALFSLLATAAIGSTTQTFAIYLTNPGNGINYCLDNQGSKDKNFNTVIGWPCDPSNPTDNELWYFDSGDRIVNYQTGKVLDRYAGKNGNSAAVDIYESNWTEAQRWSLNAKGQIISNGFCLNLQLNGLNDKGYSPVIMWTCNTYWNSVWKVRGHGSW